MLFLAEASGRQHKTNPITQLDLTKFGHLLAAGLFLCRGGAPEYSGIQFSLLGLGICGIGWTKVWLLKLRALGWHRALGLLTRTEEREVEVLKKKVTILLLFPLLFGFSQLQSRPSQNPSSTPDKELVHSTVREATAGVLLQAPIDCGWLCF